MAAHAILWKSYAKDSYTAILLQGRKKLTATRLNQPQKVKNFKWLCEFCSFVAEIEFGGMYKLAEPIVTRSAKRQFEGSMANLKDILEAGA